MPEIFTTYQKRHIVTKNTLRAQSITVNINIVLNFNNQSLSGNIYYTVCRHHVSIKTMQTCQRRNIRYNKNV